MLCGELTLTRQGQENHSHCSGKARLYLHSEGCKIEQVYIVPSVHDLIYHAIRFCTLHAVAYTMVNNYFPSKCIPCFTIILYCSPLHFLNNDHKTDLYFSFTTDSR